MICDRKGVPLEVGQNVAFHAPIVEGKVVSVQEIVPMGKPRSVKIVAEFDFYFSDEAGLQPRAPVYVTAAQEQPARTSGMKM